jgi:hypothetical protein
VLALCATPAAGQRFDYVEPGLAACPSPPAAARGQPRGVAPGAAVPGRIHVQCGLDRGSYTLTLNATDPQATFVPRSFIVNFGRLAGDGRFVARFATPGAHGVSVAITSNMGSPVPQGRFESADNEFDVRAR